MTKRYEPETYAFSSNSVVSFRGMQEKERGSYVHYDDHARDVAARDARIRELEAEVTKLTSRLNTTIRGCNQGHLEGEAT